MNALNVPSSLNVPDTGAAQIAYVNQAPYRKGVLCANMNPDEGAYVYVQLRPVNATVPTAAQVLEAWSYRIPAGQTELIEAGSATAVYLAGEETGTASVQELA